MGINLLSAGLQSVNFRRPPPQSMCAHLPFQSFSFAPTTILSSAVLLLCTVRPQVLAAFCFFC